MRISGLGSVFLAVHEGIFVRVVEEKLLAYLPAKDWILKTEEKGGVWFEA